MLPRGVIRRLNDAIASGKIAPDSAWRLCYSRISEDMRAYRNGISLSSLQLPPTNSFISQISPENVSKNGLFGLPLAVKDNFCTDADQFKVSTTCASFSLKEFRPSYSAHVVQLLLESGFSLVGKTNMDEFAMGCGSVDAPLSGPVVNPWSRLTPDGRDRIAGGSSGGSAAAVSAGLCVGSIASDTGGSCRLPSAYCGVTGLKPTYGLLSRHGLIALANCFDTPSLISLEVTDVADMLCACLDTNQPVCDSTLLNLDTNDLTLFRNELKNISCSKLPKPLKLGVPVEYHAPGLSNEILDVWERVCCWCADRLSLEIRKVSIPHMRFACATYAVLCSTEVASNMSRYDGLEFGYRARPQIMDEQANSEFGSTEELFAASRSASLGEVVRSRILAGNYFMLTKNQMNYLDAARKMWRLICSEFNDVLSDQVDFLLAPVHLTTASTILDFSLLDNRTRSSRDDVLTSPVNLAGLPAVTIPVATSKETGLPIGLQLIGPALSEPKLLSLALCIERMARFKHLVDLSEILNAD